MITINKEQTILIADDSEMNRSILADMLGDEYEIMEAENGVQAVAAIQKYGMELSLLLLDIVMPEMDGFGVLAVMNENRWIEDIPVIMITAETSSSYIERAYELGVSDFITRPFDALIVHHRVVNTILLYAKQKKLIGMVSEQIYEKEQNNNMMIDILSHIVEFRNDESGLHVRHVHTLTELLLRRLVQKTDQYKLSEHDISLISTASALHDIGKIAIDEKILNKPGRLTEEEFAVMKTHSRQGADMLKDVQMYQNELLVKYAYEICRWHHERYDGRGYPDGLLGDEIPISAQIVALADVYDALTSERVYKAAYSHETAIHMIVDGQCGSFNPQVLECLTDISDDIQNAMGRTTPEEEDQREMYKVAREMMHHDELTVSDRTLQLLEREREKYNFFAMMSREIQFEYHVSPSMVTLTPWSAEQLGMEEVVMSPYENSKMLEILKLEEWEQMARELRNTTPKDPIVQHDCKFYYQGEARWHRIIVRAMWSGDEPPVYQGVIGKAVDIHDSRSLLDSLKQKASHDALTGLLNHASSKEQIIARMETRSERKYALAIFDLDHFKSANDTYGHIFGDQVLKHVAEKLKHSIRGADIAARVGGDEFLIFLEYKMELEPVIKRIFDSLIGQYEDFVISISMGIAQTEDIGTDYEELFHAADQALYSVKRSGRGQYRFFQGSMNNMFSAISTIDGSEDAPANKNT